MHVRRQMAHATPTILIRRCKDGALDPRAQSMMRLAVDIQVPDGGLHKVASYLAPPRWGISLDLCSESLRTTCSLAAIYMHGS